jgi:late competence protein required for DNA uptake (superfamily II DNA/RNA helicase)
MVRCHRCGRLTLKKTATLFDGVYYGSDCVLRAFSTINSQTTPGTDEGRI